VTSPDWGNYPPEQQSTYSWTDAPATAQSWRTYTDGGFVNDITFKNVLRNYDANARHPEVAGPGHFNDPDYLGPELGMTDEEFRTQMTLWSVAAAPLVIGSDIESSARPPSTLSPTSAATTTVPTGSASTPAADRDSRTQATHRSTGDATSGAGEAILINLLGTWSQTLVPKF
jgi:hypothetical protein